MLRFNKSLADANPEEMAISMWCPLTEATYTLQDGDEVEILRSIQENPDLPTSLVRFHGLEYHIRDWKLETYFVRA